jgi:hypothetical protein
MIELDFHPTARGARKVRPGVYVLIDNEGNDVDTVDAMEMGEILIAEDNAREMRDTWC